MLKLCNQVKCLRVQIIGGEGVVLRGQVRTEQYMYSLSTPKEGKLHGSREAAESSYNQGRGISDSKL